MLTPSPLSLTDMVDWNSEAELVRDVGEFVRHKV